MYLQNPIILGSSRVIRSITSSSRIPFYGNGTLGVNFCLNDQQRKPLMIINQHRVGCTDAFQNCLAMKLAKGQLEVEDCKIELLFQQLLAETNKILEAIDDGEISISPYDTTWVAFIEDIGGGNPQFPSCLKWIVSNQFPDGSWRGVSTMFSAYDSLLNTLACVIALSLWKINPEKAEKGISYMKENICKLENEVSEHMTCGFEVVFPSLIDKARKLDIDIPYDSPILQDIYARRNLKLKKIPNDTLHQEHTSLLFSLEGMKDLDWYKLLELKFPDGSFMESPSATACAFLETRDAKCMQYLLGE